MTTDNKTLADVQPGGRVRLEDALPPLPAPNYPVSKTGLQNNAYTASQMTDYARAALSARQPVGEPAMYQVHPRRFPAGEGWREVSKREFDDRGDFPGYPEAEWERRALYTAPPAQAVDLGAVRDAVQGITLGFDGDLPYIKGIAEALALIDSQAVGK
ncbi:hypothetical protein MF545_12725 [Stenotrophomonas maltophilia]|nr:hypothetical protein [Stenotrophomonas maltophilia]